MRRGTTPTIRIHTNTDLRAYRCVIVVKDEHKGRVRITDDRITKTGATAETTLTTDETLALHGTRVYAQLRAYDASGTPASETELMVDYLGDDIIGTTDTETEDNV